MGKREINETVVPSGQYLVNCYGSSGRLKWTEVVGNLVTNVGKENYLQAVLKGDNTAQASTWFVGLIQGTTAAVTLLATDTSSTTNIGYSESTRYTEATRPKWSSGTVGSTATGTVSNSTSVASFTINDGTTVSGAFLASSDVKGNVGSSNNTWILHSESKFSTTRNPSSGDTIEVTIIQKAT